jgi:gas vesicle protein GvpL/GvpF
VLYVYGFMRAAEAPAFAQGGVGEPDGAVAPVNEGEVAALVTEVGPDGVAPRRANLMAHAEILRRAHEEGTVLPLRFGIVMADETAVRAELAGRAAELSRLIEELDGRLEMGVSALYHEEVVLREVLTENPAVAQAQAKVKDLPAAATHFERIRIGELVAQAVDAKRAGDSGAILRELEPHAVAVSTDDPLHERMVINAAFLVERERLEAFDAAVEETSRARADRMHFKLLGPMPPHSFVGGV